MVNNFVKGQVVTILNSTMGGRVVIEGEAMIVKPTGLSDDHYTVKFLSNPQEIYERFVDPEAQVDVNEYVNNLNNMER